MPNIGERNPLANTCIKRSPSPLDKEESKLPRCKTRRDLFPHRSRIWLAPLYNTYRAGDPLTQCELMSSTDCAYRSGMVAQPASYTHFNHHPTKWCEAYHPGCIRWDIGCSRHRGPMDPTGQCTYCCMESQGQYYPQTSLRQTQGYPGDENMGSNW